MIYYIHNNKVNDEVDIRDYYVIMNIRQGLYNIVALASSYEEAQNVRIVHGGNLFCETCKIIPPKTR
jgi:hypothetical protein